MNDVPAGHPFYRFLLQGGRLPHVVLVDRHPPASLAAHFMHDVDAPSTWRQAANEPLETA